MKIGRYIRSVLYPLNETLEKEYWDRQLDLMTAPLTAALALGTLVTWGLILSVWWRSEATRAVWAIGLIFQAWLIFCYYALKASGRTRYLAAYFTPVIPCALTYIFQKHVIPVYPTKEMMIQAHALPLILMLCFYAFETISLKLAILSGLSISAVMVLAQPVNLKLVGIDFFYFMVQITIANIAGIIMCIFGCYTSRQNFKFSRVAEKEREISDSLIKRVFPEIIGQELRSRGSNLARTYQNVTVLLADLANFTRITTTMEPKQLVTILHELFHRFDQLAEQHGVEKIKTIGDAYMAASGCPTHASNHTERMAYFALELQNTMQSFNKSFNTDFQIRIGIDSGPVVGGVISGKRISFDIWGETVNLASRLQTVAEPGEIILSDATSKALRGAFVVSEYRMVDLKGLGAMPVARLISPLGKNPFLSAQSRAKGKSEASEIAFLSQH